MSWIYTITWNVNSNDEFFEELIYESFFIIFHMVILGQLILHNPSYGHSWTIPKTTTSF